LVKFSLVDFLPKDASRCLPDVDENGESDYVVVFTRNKNGKGERDIAKYNAKKKLWYSLSDPTGFANVWQWSNFLESDKFVEDEEVYKYLNGDV